MTIINLNSYKSALTCTLALCPHSTPAPEKRPITRSILADARARVHSAQVKPESMTSAQIARVLVTLPRIAPIYVTAAQVRKERREGGLFTVDQLARC